MPISSSICSDAVVEAEKRAEELEGEGDTLGALTWYRIAGVIAELQKAAPNRPAQLTIEAASPPQI